MIAGPGGALPSLMWNRDKRVIGDNLLLTQYWTLKILITSFVAPISPIFFNEFPESFARSDH